MLSTLDLKMLKDLIDKKTHNVRTFALNENSRPRSRSKNEIGDEPPSS